MRRIAFIANPCRVCSSRWLQLVMALVIACILCGVSPCRLHAQNLTLVPTITTFAGGGSYSADDIPATAAGISPTGTAVDRAGNVYIANFQDHRVRRVDLNGIITTVAGNGVKGFAGDGGPATSANLNFPYAVVFDKMGNLYIADSGNERIRRVDPTGTITTVAGNGVAGFSGDGGLATLAQLSAPIGVATDNAGKLYIVDQSNSRIRAVDNNGIITTVAGNGIQGYGGEGGPATSAELNFPAGVAADGAGNLYIADYFNNRIRKVDLSGRISTVAGDGTSGYGGDGGPGTSAQLSDPTSVAVDSVGNLFIADFNNSCVRKMDLNGVITTVAGNGIEGFSGDNGPSANAQLDLAIHLTVDGGENLYITDFNNYRIRKISTSPVNFGQLNLGANSSQNVFLSINQPLTLASVQSSGDYSVLSNSCTLNTLLSANTTCTLQVQFAPGKPGPRSFPLRVTDTSSNQYTFGLQGTGIGSTLALTPGVITTVAGTGTAGYGGDNGLATTAAINYPYAVTVDSAGNMYIADTNNHRIRRVDSNGTITTVAGTGTQGYTGDNMPATASQLNLPWGLALDSAGNLYIADTFNNRIRKVDANGIIQTVAGNGVQGYGGDNGPATAASLLIPTRVAVDSAGNLFIADYGNSRVRRVDANGIITTIAGNGTWGNGGDGGAAISAQLTYPNGIAVDGQGNLYLADLNNHSIRKVDGRGTITTVAGTGADGYNGDGKLATTAQLSWPYGVAADSAGNFYIAERYGQRIRKVDVNGIITTVAGTGDCAIQNHAGQCYNGDNIVATTAELMEPNFVALDGSGNLYISDETNSRIRKVNVATSALSFPSLNVGQVSPMQTVVVSDVGNATLNFTGFATSSDFRWSGGDCLTGGQLGIGSSCSVGAVFAPLMAGNPLIESLTVTDDAFNSPQSVILTGVALGQIPPTVTFTGAPPSAPFGASFGVTATTNASTTAVITASGACSVVGTSVTMTAGTGTCSLTATWAADANYTAASLNQYTIAMTADSATSITSNTPNPSTTGQAVMVGFKVTGTAGVPTGSVTITASTNESCNGGLTAGAGSCSLTFATTGTRTLTAVYGGDGNFSVSSSSGVSQAVLVPGADLIESGVTIITSAPISGGSLVISDTATNQGTANAAASWTRFYLSTDRITKGTVLGARNIPILPGGTSSGPASTSFTLPLNLNGTYYVIACADDTNLVVESNETNNCTASGSMLVAGADLIETSVSASSTAVAGGTIVVSDTALNQGSGNAGVSWTRFYLSANGTTKGAVLGPRNVPALNAGSSSGPINTTFALPLNLNGAYFVIACADDTNAVVESVETNNCTASLSIQVAGADLVEAAVNAPATGAAGNNLVVADTATNQGTGNAGVSWTRFYLSTNGTTKSTVLGTRSVPALTTGTSSGLINTTVILPANISGTFYIIACADDTNAVVESNETNNCMASGSIMVH